GRRRSARRADTVRPDPDRVRQLREEHGWTQAGLAERADCSVRTVESIEAGNPVKRVTLAGVAHALDVAPETIIARPRAAADGTQRTKVVIELVLDHPAASFTGGFTEGEREEFQRALKERLSLSVTPRVMSRPGAAWQSPSS